jgi:hypothetical protein
MISEPTNARVCEYIIHTVYYLHVSAIHVAIFREVLYKGYIHLNVTGLNHKYFYVYFNL